MKRVLLLIAVVGLLAVPSMAQGWFIEIGDWYSKPGNAQEFGEFVDNGKSIETHEPVEFDMDHEHSWELGFGYDSGDYGVFSLTYWNGYEGDYEFFTDDSQYDGNSSTWFTPGGNNYYDMFYAFGTDAWTVDFKWTNGFGGEGKWSGEYYVGMRYFDYELSANNYNYYDSTDWVRKTWDANSNGLGFSGGVTGIFSFSDRYSVHGGFDIAFLRGDRDVDTDWDGYSWGEEMKFSYNNELFTQFGIDLGFKFFLTDNLYGDFGYKYSRWMDASTNLKFKEFGQVDLDESEDVTWEGFYMALGWDFGK